MLYFVIALQLKQIKSADSCCVGYVDVQSVYEIQICKFISSVIASNWKRKYLTMYPFVHKNRLLRLANRYVYVDMY